MPLFSINANHLTHGLWKTGLLTCILVSMLVTSSCSIIGSGHSSPYGKRSLGTRLNDQSIESRGKFLLKDAHAELGTAHINITAFNGTVLITGQVASDSAKLVATNTLKGLPHVKIVRNELDVAGATSILSRTNDSYLTTKVKAALVFDKDTEGRRTKVVTENGVVFLLGLLTRDEADLAVKRVREVFGVEKIVTVFEYLN